MKKPKKLRLYVWEDVLTSYTSGVMFALATSPDHARKIILTGTGDSPSVRQDLASRPRLVSRAEGFAVWGGD